MDGHPFPPYTIHLTKLAPLWEYGIHNWTQILGCAPHCRLYFLDERELQWANPTMVFPFPQALTHVLKYLRAMFSSTDEAHRRHLAKNISAPIIEDYHIAPRWWGMME